MTDELAIGLAVFGPSIAIALWLLIRKPNRRSDKRINSVPEWHRTIQRNGFKSRIGAPYRSY
jgi:hypothetical protein